jgi:hypothetical protein
VFVIGSIFFKEDKVKLDKILDYFDQDQTTYVDLDYEITNYKDERVKIVENKYEIDNGNYHILMIITVPTDDPNEKFICNEYPRHDFEDIIDFVVNYHQRYGKVKEVIPTEISVNQNSKLAHERVLKRTDNRNSETQFDLNMDIEIVDYFESENRHKVKTQKQTRKNNFYNNIHETQNLDISPNSYMMSAASEQNYKDHQSKPLFATDVSKGYFTVLNNRAEIEQSEITDESKRKLEEEGMLYYDL